MLCAALGLEFLVLVGASGWGSVGNGGMNYGQDPAQNGNSNYFFKGLVRTPGFLNAAMVWPAAFTVH